MTIYKLTVTHDQGTMTVKTSASSKEAAIKKVCDMEGCPKRAIIKVKNIEDEIPFWEFLDIEYDHRNREFLFTAYYKQKASFPELFKRMIGSPMLHKIDDELTGKVAFRIYTQEWKPREALDYEIEAELIPGQRLFHVG